MWIALLHSPICVLWAIYHVQGLMGPRPIFATTGKTTNKVETHIEHIFIGKKFITFCNLAYMYICIKETYCI